MAHEKEYPAPLSDNNEGDGYDHYDDINMSSSSMSFGEPDLDEIALQDALMVLHLAADNVTQADSHDEYNFVDDFEDLYMPDIVESFDGPDQDDATWQIALVAMNGAPDEIRDDNGQPR
ncbi:hypothetical protein BGZ47_010991 [Haplosporangium gracile]|nr:hypothetical protein BGZ47_010991 [Haplosporangium gracile]